MGKWVKDRLDSFCHIEMGQSPDSSGYNSEGVGLPLIQGNADIENRKTIKRNFTSIITKTAFPGEIILTVRAPVGNVAVATDECCLGRGVCAISNSNVDKHFLYHALIWRESEWQKLEQGSTFTAVGHKEVESFSIEYPVLENEQRHIAEILTACDEVIEKSEAVVDKYRAIKAGMLKDIFTRGIGKNGRLRPPPESAPQLYKDTVLGKVPCEWEVVPLGKLFSVQLGKMLDAAKNVGVKKPYLGNRAVQWGRIDVADIETVRLTDEDLLRFRLRKGDLLVCEGGEVGRAAIWQDELPECYYQKALHRVRLKEGMYYSITFLFYQLQLFSDRRLFDAFVTQTSIAHLTKEKLEIVPIFDIELNEQQRIAERLSVIDAKIADELAVVAKYRKVKAGLMARLLTPPDMEVE